MGSWRSAADLTRRYEKCVVVLRRLCIPLKISALKESYQPSSIMHIIIHLNVARGRINHFPTAPPPPPLLYITMEMKPFQTLQL